MTYSPSSQGRSIVEGLAPTRRDILLELKLQTGVTVESLAEHLGLSPGAVRHQLALLAAEGYVTYEGQPRDGRGRRPREYRLTRKGDELFPSSAGDLAFRLLSRLQRTQPDAVQKAISEEAEESEAQARFSLRAVRIEDRLNQLAQYYEDTHFLPTMEMQDDGSVMLALNHSPVAGLAEVIEGVWELETAPIRAAFPDGKIERLEHRSQGNARSLYRIRPGKK